MDPDISVCAGARCIPGELSGMLRSGKCRRSGTHSDVQPHCLPLRLGAGRSSPSLRLSNWKSGTRRTPGAVDGPDTLSCLRPKDGRFCVDLDRIQSHRNGLPPQIRAYTRSPDGCGQSLPFGKAISREFGTADPFPDDLPRALARWRDHVVSKHDKENSPEGTLYRYVLAVHPSVAEVWASCTQSMRPSVNSSRVGVLPPPYPGTDPDEGSIELRSDHVPEARIAQMLSRGVADPAIGSLM